MSIPISNVETASTKREILQHIASIFDPLNFFCHYTESKIVHEKIWINKCEWDEKVSNELLTEWNDICRQLEQISSYHLPEVHWNF